MVQYFAGSFRIKFKKGLPEDEFNVMKEKAP